MARPRKDDTARQICGRIKTARTEAGLTQEEAAKGLGLTLRGYTNYERNRVPYRRLEDMAELFGVTHEWLLHGTNGNGPVTPDVHAIQEMLEERDATLRTLLDEVRELRAIVEQQQRRRRRG